MAKNLRPQQRKFFDFMSGCKSGQLLSAQDILQATGWEPDTLGTYVRKNKLDMFLAQTGPEQFRVLRDGQSLSKDDVARAFTQVSPGQLTLVKGLPLSGEKEAYSLRKDIGHGAVAHVWEAVVEGSNKVVAVKIMNPRPDLLDPLNLPNVRQRFRRESRNGMKLEHPRVIPYRDVGEVSGFPFVVMDLADGTLASLLKERTMTAAESLEPVLACLEALDYLHSSGCVHRDVKPANILWFKDAGYVLGDLGIVLWSDMNPAFTSAGTITRTSLQLGSWYYMAPEQRHSPHSAVPASDVYALGVTWYQALTGQTLDPAAIAAKRYPLAASEPDVNTVLGAMLEFEPADRPAVSQLRIELLRLKKELGPDQASFSFA